MVGELIVDMFTTLVCPLIDEGLSAADEFIVLLKLLFILDSYVSESGFGVLGIKDEPR